MVCWLNSSRAKPDPALAEAHMTKAIVAMYCGRDVPLRVFFELPLKGTTDYSAVSQS